MDYNFVSQKAKLDSGFSVSSLPRCRWNVVDLVTVFAGQAVPTYLFCDVDMTWVRDWQSRLRQQGLKVTTTAILLKAIGLAQRAHPASRSAALPWGRIVTFQQISAGFTVEKFVGDRASVFFGIIENPDTKLITTIAAELRAYAESKIGDIAQLNLEHRFSQMPWLVRQAVLKLGELFPGIRLRFLGATFGLSSLGKYGVTAVTGPCVCTSTFGVGAVEERPVVRSGKVEIRPIMTLTLAFDHRTIDGVPAARFLQDVRLLMEGELANYIDHDQLHMTA